MIKLKNTVIAVLWAFIDAIANSVYYVADKIVNHVVWFWEVIGPRGRKIIEYAAGMSFVILVCVVVAWLVLGMLYVLTNGLSFLNWLISVGYF